MRAHLAFAAPAGLAADPSIGLLPIGLLELGAELDRAGHTVRVVHLGRASQATDVSSLLEGEPDLIGLSCFTFQRHETLDLARRLRARRPGALIVLGGPHASALPGEILARESAIDAVLCGEAEATLLEVLERRSAGRTLDQTPGLWTRAGPGPARAPLTDLDALAPVSTAGIAIEGVDRLLQLRHLVAGRGCPCSCSFCAAPVLAGRRVRRHSIGWLVGEVQRLFALGIPFLSFRDDTFTADRAWTRAFSLALRAAVPDLLWDCQSRADALDPETIACMRRAGCVQVQLGVESGSPRVLRTLRKALDLDRLRAAVRSCREVGLLVSCYLIAGTPGEEAEDVSATEALVAELRPASVVVARLCAYPGTALAADIEAARWFEDPRPDLLVREDRAASKAFQSLTRLSERVRATSPLTLDEARSAAERLGDAPAAWLAFGDLAEQLGQGPLARKAYERVLCLSPENPWAHLALGEAALARAQFRVARRELERVLDRVPGWPYPLDRLGWALIGLGQRARGLELIARAQFLQPLLPAPPPVALPGRARSAARGRGSRR